MDGRTIPDKILIDLRNYARHKSIEVTMMSGNLALIGLSVGAIYGTSKLLVAAGQAFRRLPLWLQLTSLGILGFLIINPRTRAFLSNTIRTICTKSKPILDGMGMMLITQTRLMAEAKINSAKALIEFERKLPPSKKTTLATIAYAVCADSDRHLSLDEIAARVPLAGYKTKSKDIKPYLRKVLRKHNYLTQLLDGTWTIKEIYGIKSAE